MTEPRNDCSAGSAVALIARADKYLNTGSGEYASEIMRDMAEFIRKFHTGDAAQQAIASRIADGRSSDSPPPAIASPILAPSRDEERGRTNSGLVRAALEECAARCRYDGDLFHDQDNVARRDASWMAADMATNALASLAAQPPAAPVEDDELIGLNARLSDALAEIRLLKTEILHRGSSAATEDAEEVAYERATSIPIAWIAFADNGNIRLWTSDRGRAEEEKRRGLDLRAFNLAELVALISRIPVEPQAAPVSWGLKTNPELLALIERAKTYVMSPEEKYEQRRSFTRGMCPSNRDYKEWCEAVDRLLPPLSLSRPESK